MKTADIINPVRRTLRDNFPSGYAHLDDDFVDYLNRAISFIAVSDSSATVVTGEVPLIAGGLQALPDGGIRVLKLFYNNLASTVRSRIGPRTYSGKHVLKNMSILTLSSQIADWAGAKVSSIATIYCFNTEDPSSFIVYPPNDGTGKVMASYSAYPVKITVIDAIEDIPLSAKYFTILIDLVIGYALSRDSESANNMQRAQAYIQSAVSQLGVKDSADITDTPTDTTGDSNVS